MPFALIYHAPEGRRAVRRTLALEVDEDGRLVAFQQQLGEDDEPLTYPEIYRMLHAVLGLVSQVVDVDHLQSDVT